jgi:hypothetical protein
MEAMRMAATHKFHANPVDRKALAGDRIGSAISAQLTSKKRPRPDKEEEGKEEGQWQVVQKPFAPTVPQAPRLRTEERASVRQSMLTVPDGVFEFKSKPSATTMATRGVAATARRNQRIRKIVHPAKPFVLQTDLRAELHQAELHRRLEQEKQQEENARHFVAQPAPATLRASMAMVVEQPKRGRTLPRPLADIGNVVLASDERAKRREEFDKGLKARQEAAEEERAREEAERQ